MQSSKSKSYVPGIAGIGLISLTLGACSTIDPPRNKSTESEIASQLKAAAAPRQQAPAIPQAVAESLLPAPRSTLPKTTRKALDPRFDLSVKDAPIDQVLSGIVADTRFSLLIKPKTQVGMPPGVAPLDTAQERVTIDLRDVTVTEALDAIREVYGYDYTVEGRRIYVTPPELQTRLYQVDYVIGQRRGVSDLKVIGGASIGASNSTSNGSSSGSNNSSTSNNSSNSSSNGSTSGSNYSSVQASALATLTKSDMWGEMEDVIRTTLGCRIFTGSDSKDSSDNRVGSEALSKLPRTSENTLGSSRADVSFLGDSPHEVRRRGVDGCTNGRAITLSPMSGTLMIRGMPNEHRAIEKMLKSMQVSLNRQVIIEAKIIDVELNAEAQQGINWASFSNNLHRGSLGSDPNRLYQMDGAGAATGGRGLAAESFDNLTLTNGMVSGTVNPSSLGGLLGAGMVGTGTNSAFSAGLGIALQLRNFAAMINFLQTQGKVHVLSSPRISTINNQKAVIKVGTEEPFVASISPAQSATSGAQTVAIASANLNYAPFFSGIALDVTPQIDDKGTITLHVHALVNDVQEINKVATPTVNSVSVPFAINSVNETDNVVRAEDGQVIVIGGLMKESTSDGRSKVPGLGDALGPLFKKGAQSSSKRELVILLKPSIVKDSSDWAKDINAVQSRLGAGE